MSTIVLAVGHSRSGDSGAVNTNGVSEHKFNTKIARLTGSILDAMGHKVHIIGHYEGKGYSAAISWAAKEIKRLGADVAAEMHFNSAGPYAEGHEWLCWHRSVAGAALARCFHAVFQQRFPDRKARGVKLCDSESRGGLFLRLTHCPSVLLEPYFGSNEEETDYFSAREIDLAQAYADALHQFCRPK